MKEALKGNVKAIIIVFIVLIIYTIGVGAYAKSKQKKLDDEAKTPEKKQEKQKTPDDNEKITKYDFNLVLSSKQFLGYKDGKWYQNSDYDYTNKDFDVYADGQKYDYRSLVYTDRWYIKNPDSTFLDYSNSFLAVSADIDYSLVVNNGGEVTEEQKKVVEEFLQSKNINYNINTLKISAFVNDLNRDGIQDTIYTVSNLFLTDYTGYDKTFAFVFVRTLNQNVVLFEDTYKAINAVSICDPFTYSVITIDGKNSLLVGCEYYSMGGIKYMVYSLNEKTPTTLLTTTAN